MVPLLLHPKSRGSIKLRSADPFDHPLIDPKYLSHPDDVKTLISGKHKLRGLFKKFCYEWLSMRKDNVCLTDFVHKYSSFYHTCTFEISKESSKYQLCYWP